MSYTVFVRNWWRVERGRYSFQTRLVPNPGARRTWLAKVETYDQAREMCDQWNSTHKPGRLSRKAEFTATENY